MSKKPRKVEEARAADTAQKPARKAPRASVAAKGAKTEFECISGKLFAERQELLHKLAQ